MANWNDQRPSQMGFGAAPGLSGDWGRSSVIDAGLRRHMLAIYNYMASGILLSGIIALGFAQSGLAEALMHSPLRIVVALAPLAFVMVMSFGINRLSTATMQALFWAFSAVMGMSLSSIFFVYTGSSIAVTFFATSGAFAGLSLFGYTTRKSLSAMGTFLIMGLFGILIASVVNMFLQSGGLAFGISFLGVLIFAGLTAYHTQMLKEQYGYVRGTDMAGKAVIMGALQLYLDFINMFLMLLRFMGDRR
ncbi:Bax inhibitor-1/YccA family protein [Novosphingobium acidiphilum]|jgi:FtsH-binding integral membrane protein|uniref:Bax inhibitor-1/YccA family protein n=1 Tax=Novosphingobium acidiphilum TaxID=505248 RepID=UPI000491179C|nr:Bax inhibitor-1/YccA family protein [Novosphingobium acidiphilum]